jgi:hypothetical protein
MPNRDQGEPVFVVKGWRARPVRVWRNHLLGPFLLMGLGGVGMGLLPPPSWLLTYLAGILIAFAILKLSRGNIALHTDRLQVCVWDESVPPGTLAVPLTDILSISVDGSVLRMAYAVDGERLVIRMPILASIAEDLYDRIVEQMERRPELRGRVHEFGECVALVMPETGAESAD